MQINTFALLSIWLPLLQACSAFLSRFAGVRSVVNDGTSVSHRLIHGDCIEILRELPVGQAQIIVTSPPYNVGWRYGDSNDADRLPLPEYQQFLTDLLAGCQRVLRDGGVLAQNVPPTISIKGENGDPAWPLAAWLAAKLREQGWLVRQPIVWVKVRRGLPFASTGVLGIVSNLRMRPCYEVILVASKGVRRRPSWQAWSQKPVLREWLKDVWLLPPAPKGKRGDPQRFPDELVERLLHLFSDPGDLVIDPCAGLGTTGRVARHLRRRAWLIEREPSYLRKIRDALGLSVSSAPEA